MFARAALVHLPVQGAAENGSGSEAAAVSSALPGGHTGQLAGGKDPYQGKDRSQNLGRLQGGAL